MGRSGQAFTLMEMILVVVIIAILAALVLPRVTGQTQEARIAAARAEISSVRSALGQFESAAGRFPTDSEGLQALVERPASLPEEVDWQRYLNERTVPEDPWGRAYVYRRVGDEDYELFSTGPDGRPDTEDDIGYKEE